MHMWKLCAVAATAAAAAAFDGLQWHKPLVGRPQTQLADGQTGLRFVASTKRTRGSLLSISENNAVAVYDSETGLLRWKYTVSGSSHDIISYEVCSPDIVLVAEGAHTSKQVSALSLVTGDLLWAKHVAHDAPFTCTWTDTNTRVVDGDNYNAKPARDFFLAQNGVVERYSITDGTPKWDFDAGAHLDDIRVACDNGSCAVVAHGINDAFSLAIDTDTKTVVSSATLESIDPEAPLLVTGSGVLVQKDANGRLRTWNGNSAITWSPPRRAKAVRNVIDVDLLHRDIFVVQLADFSCLVLAINEATHAIDTLWDFGANDKPPNALFSGFVDKKGFPHVARVHYSASLGLAQVVVFSSEPTKISPTGLVNGYSFQYDHRAWGEFSSFALEALPLEEYRVVARIAFGTTRASVQMWRGEKQVWLVDEGLAHVDAKPLLAMAPVPEDSNDDSFIVPDALFSVLQVAPSSLQDPILSFFDSAHKAIKTLAPLSVQRLYTQASRTDPDMQSILILGSARTGVIYGVQAVDGTTLWRSVLPAPRVSHLNLLKEGPASVVVSFTIAGTPYTFDLDPLTGKQTLMKKDSAPACLPPQTFTQPSPISPYAVWDSNTLHSPSGAWSLSLSNIESVSSSHYAAVASRGLVLGSRETLVKYLNPHLIAAVDHPEPNTAVIYLVDTITGSPVVTLRVPGVACDEDNAQPCISLFLAENWLVYSYQGSDISRKTRIVSVELYEGYATHDDASKPPTWSARKKDSVPALVFSRTFLPSANGRILAPTTTKLGITTKNALYATAHQLFSIPHVFLDPRRPFGKPSSDDAEEGLIPYMADLMLSPMWTLSHALPLDLSAAASFPSSRLESTALVLAYGGDLFFSESWPSRPFDILSRNFAKGQLLLVLLVLSVLLFVTWPMVSNKDLKARWAKLQ